MKPGRILLIIAGLVIALILAFFLQDFIRQAVVTPLAYLWWVLKLFYASIPQLLLWILLLVFLVLVVTHRLVNWNTVEQPNDEPSKPAQGPVEILAGWISNTGQGNYFKWRIANRLGKLRRELEGYPENRGLPAHIDVQDAPGRLPPEAVQRYLKAGLDGLVCRLPPAVAPFYAQAGHPLRPGCG